MSRPHFLFVTIEFADPIFSGNGTYSRSLVRGLTDHGIDVTVVCAVPSARTISDKMEKVSGEDVAEQPFIFDFGAGHTAQSNVGVATVYPIRVPEALWKKLDRDGPWHEFAQRFAVAAADPPGDWISTIADSLTAMTAVPQEKKSLLPSAAFDEVLCVDWTGHYAYRYALAHLRQHELGLPTHAHDVAAHTTFLNFRVFANPILLTDGDEEPQKQEDRESVASKVQAALWEPSSPIVTAGPAVQEYKKAVDGLETFQFYLLKESAAMLCSKVSIGLCKTDAAMLDTNLQQFLKAVAVASTTGDNTQQLIAEDPATPVTVMENTPEDVGDDGKTERVSNASSPPRPCEVLLCPIRDDVLEVSKDPSTAAPDSLPTVVTEALHKAMQTGDEMSMDQRRFLVCGVRLSRDKNADLFVDLVEQLSEAGTLKKFGLVPVLFGAEADKTFAQECVKGRLRDISVKHDQPMAIIDQFIGPDDIKFIFHNAILNFHPSLYDAYGLSIVEAAVFGCPTLLHCPEAKMGHLLGITAPVASSLKSPVGATDLLQVQQDVLGFDFSGGAALLTMMITKLIEEEAETKRMATVAAAGKTVAEKWTSYECVGKLLQYVGV